MKKYLLFVLFSICISTNAQNNKIVFEYDSAGNQIKRYLCINCPSETAKSAVKEIEDITENDLQKFSSNDVISFYPNPVKEELYIQWELSEKDYVNSIYLYGITGQVLKNYAKTREMNSQIIPFQNYPTGVYIVALFYNNGEKKTIKIIKE